MGKGDGEHAGEHVGDVDDEVWVRAVVSMRMSMRMRKKMRMKMRMRAADASDFGIPRADVDAVDFLTKIPFRNACKMAFCRCFLAHV